ncbi:MAG: hypothetical protein SA378_08555 [Sedimentibacter sp.]|uniref:hypothetical protein n=1 Tax=Sedimentibacter sp. TaxID=1960295 RepID=UPI002981D52B|nr:hypothetical protein [Sedimentibacter sp.]MDW5300171.1 hypothetical protein [Sedimentibacter sp.]
MKEKNKFIRVYTGTEISVISLKDRLEKNGISNDSSNSFFRGVPIAIDLYIQEFDFIKAEPIINEFIQNNKG